ncbi:hypothetical protein JCM8547_008113 [Rhodosporidiobolus lusitaniae]
MVSAPETQAALGKGAPPSSTSSSSKFLRPKLVSSSSSSSNENGNGTAYGTSSARRTSFYGSLKSALKRTRSSAQSAQTLASTLAAPPPTAGGDGLTTAEAAAPSDPKQKGGLFHSLWEQVKEGTFVGDVGVIFQALGSATGPLDDREDLLEHLVWMLQGLPKDSPLQEPVTQKLIELLWHDLPHSGAAYSTVGPNYRAADGGQNAPAAIGAANTPYARSVPPLHPKSPYLPDPTLVFDTLLKRDKFKPHPSGISSLLFSFATIIIHSCFQTGRKDRCENEASSYLDLSPLYGNTSEEQKTVRTFVNGRLHPDVIASSRLFFMPPSVVALLMIFNRNHNFIVEHLYKINEKGTFKPWEQLDEAGKTAQDRALFEQGRLVNCGHFLNVIVQDYIRTILNLNRTESTWSLAPNPAIRDFPSGFSPRGVGNTVSVEFNILYRWHAAISEKDEKWIEGLFREYVGDKDIGSLTETDFTTALRGLSSKLGSDPKQWTIPGLTRQADGRFADADLCKILTEATDEIAGAFGANGSPACMRIIDVLGIATARNDWNTCTMNEFRRFLNLKPFADFEEWNSDPVVAQKARHLYSHIDNLELFPGLHAEEAKKSGKGAGLCGGYSITRGILSDATALVRGDRFFTTDYNSATLSSWGYQDVTPDTSVAYGGVIGKLLMRNLPASYTYNSVYALFPFSTPATMKEILTKNGVVDQYDLTPPGTIPTPPIHGLTTYAAAMEVLLDPKRFSGHGFYDAAIKACSNEYGYFIAQEGEQHRLNRKLQSDALFPEGWQQKLASFYREKTEELVKARSWSPDGGKTMTLDVVRDVTNLTAVYWCSHQFGIPLKEPNTPHGLFTPQELYLILSAFFISVFMNFDLSASFKLRAAAKKAAPALLGVIRLRLSQTKGVPAVLDHLARHLQDLILDKTAQGVVMGTHARAYYLRLLEATGTSIPLKQLESSVQSTMTASVSNQGQATAQVINFFLDDANKAHKDELVQLSLLNTPEADAQILGLVNEAMRLDPQVPLIPRVALVDTVIKDGDRTVEVKKGDYVFPSMVKAGLDPLVFSDPEQVKERDPKLYRLFGHGAHTCLGAPMVEISVVQMVKQIFRLPNVRRPPGQAGQLVRFSQNVGGTDCHVYVDAKASPWPLPVSLSIVYDGEQ